MGIQAAYAVPHPPLIVPAVGRGAEARIERTVESYAEVARRIAQIEPDTVIVSSPHAPAYRDGFHLTCSERIAGSMADFGAPKESLSFDCDHELANAVATGARRRGLPIVESRQEVAEMDHATFVPLWFLERAWNDARQTPLPRVVRIGISGLGLDFHRALGALVADEADRLGRKAVWIASGDLSHKLREDGPYGFDPAGPIFDEKVCGIFRSGNLAELSGLDEGLCEAAAECGLRSFVLMSGALGHGPFASELLSHEDLGVGYAVAAFERHEAKASADSYDVLRLARWAVERSVLDGVEAHCPSWAGSALLSKRAGVFVSLHKAGELRGCIGTVSAVRANIAEEILANAYAAVHEDPRFSPVTPDELDALEVSVDVLGDSEPARLEDLDVKRYGVIVTKGWRRGLLLPDLEGVDSVEKQVSIAKMKAGIGLDEQGVVLERFEAVRYE